MGPDNGQQFPNTLFFVAAQARVVHQTDVVHRSFGAQRNIDWKENSRFFLCLRNCVLRLALMCTNSLIIVEFE